MISPAGHAAFMRVVSSRVLSEMVFTSRSPFRILRRLLMVILILSSVCCSDPYARLANLDSRGTTIVCFGDSITAGYGVGSRQAFPALLAERLEMPVINAGRSGDTTHDGLARLERDVFPHKPRVVIVEFGGNDFRRKVDKADTIENLHRIVERVTHQGAMVVVMEVKIGLLRDKYRAGYEDVAEANDAFLIPNFMAGILGNHKLTTDGIHPNAEGHRLIAERVLEKLVPLLEKADQARTARQESP